MLFRSANTGTPLFAANLTRASGKPVATDGDGAGGRVTLSLDAANSAEAGPPAAGNKGTRADQSQAQFSFSAHGQPTGLSQTGKGAGEANTGITYTPEGLVESVTGPEGDKVTYTYFSTSLIRAKPNIRVVSRTPGARGGPVITSSFTSYDLRYNLPVGSAKNANGKSLAYTLTTDNKEIGSIDYGGGARSAWTYNEYGQRLSESMPDGVSRQWDPAGDTG